MWQTAALPYMLHATAEDTRQVQAKSMQQLQRQDQYRQKACKDSGDGRRGQMPLRQGPHPRRALSYLTVTSSRLRNKAVMTAGYFLAKRATSSWDKEPAYMQTVLVTMTTMVTMIRIIIKPLMTNIVTLILYYNNSDDDSSGENHPNNNDNSSDQQLMVS